MPEKSITCPFCGKAEVLFSYRICSACGKEVTAVKFMTIYEPIEEESEPEVIEEAEPEGIRGISADEIVVDEAALIDEPEANPEIEQMKGRLPKKAEADLVISADEITNLYVDEIEPEPIVEIEIKIKDPEPVKIKKYEINEPMEAGEIIGEYTLGEPEEE